MTVAATHRLASPIVMPATGDCGGGTIWLVCAPMLSGNLAYQHHYVVFCPVLLSFYAKRGLLSKCISVVRDACVSCSQSTLVLMLFFGFNIMITVGVCLLY